MSRGINLFQTSSMRNFILLIIISFKPIIGVSQIFKFKHSLKQSDIDAAGFTLHQPTLLRIHDESTFGVGSTFTLPLTVDYFDTLEISQTITITPSNNIILRISSSSILPGAEATNNQTIANSNIYTVNKGVTVNIPANSIIYVKPELDCTTISISTSGTAFTPNDRIRALHGGNLVRLPYTTMGVITVAGYKIIFDPWRVTKFKKIPNGFKYPLNAATTVPLELKDGRQNVSQATKVLVVPYRHYTISINSIPFRYRGRIKLADTLHATGTVTTSFNLALSVGHTWGRSSITTRGRNDLAFTLGAFIGPSSVDLTTASVNNPFEFKSGRTNPVLSYGINTILSRNGLGVLLAMGFDRAYGKYGKNWIYNNKPWLGFGVSASFPK